MMIRRQQQRREYNSAFFGGTIAILFLSLKFLLQQAHLLQSTTSNSATTDPWFLTRGDLPSSSVFLEQHSSSYRTTNNNNNNNNNETSLPLLSEKQSLDDVDTHGGTNSLHADDANCIFRNATIYRKVFVYPTYEEVDAWNKGDILSEYGKTIMKNNTAVWPWLEIDQRLRLTGQEQYDAYSVTAQFSTELLVREIMTHPQSCLRTYNPHDADLFYIPYLPSIEFHAGKRGKPPSFQTSPYAQAILDAIEGRYEAWERLFGWTSKYWKRRGGSDHILVFSEPLQGLTHPKNKRGNYHFVHTQRQLDPPIVISVELSTTFVNMYPKCAAKNILMPYPINDGRYFNGGLWQETQETLRKASLWENVTSWSAALPMEIEIYHHEQKLGRDGKVENNNNNNNKTSSSLLVAPFISPRPFSHWLKAGIHGSCTQLRQSMNRDYKCTKSCEPLRKGLVGGGGGTITTTMFAHNMRMSTFCPCPGGDTASAKRMFDAIFAGCIPVILSYDFVWPLSTELEREEASGGGGGGGGASMVVLQPADFSLRWQAQEFTEPKYDTDTCELRNASDLGLEERLQRLSARELVRLRNGLRQAAELYSYYKFRSDLPDNPLPQRILPDGGAAHALVAALGERARGRRWPECAEELSKRPSDRPEPTAFVC